jgi:hypothetical protein
LDLKGRKTDRGENCIMMNFIVCIVRVIKSRRLTWAGHVARMGRGKVFTGFWFGDPKGRDHWEDLDVGGRIT